MAWTIRKKQKGLSGLRKRAAKAYMQHMHQMGFLGARAKGSTAKLKEAA